MAIKKPIAERIKCCLTDIVHTPSEAEYNAIVPMITSINILIIISHGIKSNFEAQFIQDVSQVRIEVYHELLVLP